MLTILCVVAVAWVALGTLLYVLQDRLVFFPTREHVASPADVGLPFEELMLPAAGGARISAWYVRAPEPRGTLLFCHGNAGNISHRLDSIALFVALGLDVLIFDYEGYGRSTGRPSEDALYRDARACFDHLTGTRDVPPARIVVFGRSLGAGAAVWLASEVRPAALIVESAFTSVYELARELYPAFVVRPMVRHRFENLSRIAVVRCPILVIHSRGDDLIPFAHGERLFQAAPEPKAFLEIEGSHDGGFLASGATYRAGIARFLDPLLPAAEDR